MKTYQSLLGTGSRPPPPHGWHEKIRLMPKYNPLKGPQMRSASIM